MPEATTKDIHACACGKMVAWLRSPKGHPLPVEIKKAITIEPDGTKTVIVATEDVHNCRQYPGLARFVRDAVDRSHAQQIRIRLPTDPARPVVLSWTRENTRVRLTNGRARQNLRSYGSFNLRTGGYRVRVDANGLKDLLDEIERDPTGFDWTGGREQSHCCFCGRPLNDPRSVRLGYGPTCAVNHGLPWW